MTRVSCSFTAHPRTSPHVMRFTNCANAHSSRPMSRQTRQRFGLVHPPSKGPLRNVRKEAPGDAFASDAVHRAARTQLALAAYGIGAINPLHTCNASRHPIHDTISRPSAHAPRQADLHWRNRLPTADCQLTNPCQFLSEAQGRRLYCLTDEATERTRRPAKPRGAGLRARDCETRAPSLPQERHVPGQRPAGPGSDTDELLPSTLVRSLCLA